MNQWLSILLCLLSIFCQAQNDDNSEYIKIATEGNAFEISREERLNSLTVKRDGTPLLITSDKSHLYLRSLDAKTLRLGSSITLSSTPDKTVEKYVVKGDSLHALIKAGNRNQGYFYEYVVYRISGEFQGEVLRNKVGIEIKPDSKTTQSIYFNVADNAKFGMVCRQSNFLPNQFASFHLSITSFPQGAEEQFQLPTQIEADDLKIIGSVVSDEGLVFILTEAGIKLNSPFRNKYLLYSFNKLDKTLHEFDFSSSAFYAQELLLSVTKHGLKAIALYHTDPLAQATSNGFANIVINDSGTAISEKTINAFRGSMTKAHRSPQEKIAENEVSNLFLVDIVPCGETSFAVMEQYYKDQICQTDPRTGIISCTDQYHFNDLSFENLSNREQSITINRRQIDYDYKGNYTSQSILSNENEVLLFYNDNYKNDSLSANKIMNYASRSAMRLVRISCDGKAETWKLTEDRQADFAFMPSLEMPRFKNQVYYMMSNGRDYKLGKIDLNKLPAH